MKFDYSRKIADGSPLVFGASHSPPVGHEAAWDEFEKAGITSLRKDLYVEFTLPRDITIEQYKNNTNNVQDSTTWDPKTIPALKSIFKEAKEHNMKTIGIMGYSPRWLTYNGTAFGVPKDWEVFKDIVKKVYTLYRDDLDYVEVWNEPDHRIFLVTDKSNLTKEQAYANIYITVSNAIREVDNEINDGKKVKIIGGVESNASASKVMNYLVNDSDMNIKPDVISFHTYDTPLYLTSLKIYKNYAKKLNNPDIFITEWNNESRDQYAASYKTGDRALTFTAERLVEYLKNGIGGANYFAMLPINTSNRGTDENSMGFYKWIDNKAELLPQASSWKILSKSLGLGKGTSIIHESNTHDELQILGFTNSDNVKGSAVVNLTDTPHLIEFDLKNADVPKRAHFEVYEVSTKNDGLKLVTSRKVYIEENKLTFRYLVPEKGILGIKFVPEKEWYDVLDPIINL